MLKSYLRLELFQNVLLYFISFIVLDRKELMFM